MPPNDVSDIVTTCGGNYVTLVDNKPQPPPPDMNRTLHLNPSENLLVGSEKRALILTLIYQILTETAAIYWKYGKNA